MKPQLFCTSESIAQRVAELGKKISDDYVGNSKPVVLVCVLKGAIVFFADLIRNVEVPINIAFISVSSYVGSMESTGAVQLIQDINLDISGRDVILVEDIVDTGLTVSYLLEMFGARHPHSIKVCTLLHKPSRKRAEVQLTYVGFTIPDEFVVGYGMDYNEEYRNLSDVCSMVEV